MWLSELYLEQTSNQSTSMRAQKMCPESKNIVTIGYENSNENAE